GLACGRQRGGPGPGGCPATAARCQRRALPARATGGIRGSGCARTGGRRRGGRDHARSARGKPRLLPLARRERRSPAPRGVLTMTSNLSKAPLAAALALGATGWLTPLHATGNGLPQWDQLSEAQRATLIAPVRERWDAEPGQREAMLERARRWQQ